MICNAKALSCNAIPDSNRQIYKTYNLISNLLLIIKRNTMGCIAEPLSCIIINGSKDISLELKLKLVYVIDYLIADNGEHGLNMHFHFHNSHLILTVWDKNQELKIKSLYLNDSKGVQYNGL